jgi:TonB-dependent SusC/RagA subfamily outer membrane receptor
MPTASEAPMLRSSQKMLLMLAGTLLASMSACASHTTVSQAEPRSTPQAQTGTAADLTAREVQKGFQEPIESLLQGRTAGVQVEVFSDGSLSVRIDGAASFLASTEPLYVVDGSPITPGPGGRLTGINPHDIQSIEVLKYPPETSMYGVRGANGVIVIKTIRPTQ